jgi:hypothetical protein
VGVAGYCTHMVCRFGSCSFLVEGLVGVEGRSCCMLVVVGRSGILGLEVQGRCGMELDLGRSRTRVLVVEGTRSFLLWGISCSKRMSQTCCSIASLVVDVDEGSAVRQYR